ncbi:MAG: L-threonylcarbamoyladenylate synthase [Brevinematales bacterium]|nr:L-threonylcarbamoyladenylate synthase [Brevinematales bacterium]
MKKTILITNPRDDDFKLLGEIVKKDGLVVFPTETVYGLGGNALSENSIKKIFQVKGRPSDNPLIVHIDSSDILEDLVINPPKEAYLLFKHFAPGPLTIIFNKKPIIPDIVTAGLDTVAIRIPSHPVALRFIKECGLPIAAPSANISGRPSPTNFEMAVSEMNGLVDAIIDGGQSNVGLESTVIKIIDEEVKILRPGEITEEDLKKVLPKNFKISYNINTHKIESPGMKYTHYKPKAKVLLCDKDKIKEAIRFFNDEKVAFLLFEAVPEKDVIFVKYNSLKDYARNLYSDFYMMDKKGIKLIIAEKVEEKELGKAIMNRLKKASGGEEFTS